MGLFSWLRSPLRPLSHFATRLEDIPSPDTISLQALGQMLEVAKAAYLQALSLHEAGDERGAIGKYNEAIKANPSFWEALDNRGLSKMRCGEYAEAIPDFETSAQITPDSPLAFVALIRCYKMTKQFRKAYLTSKYCIRKWPDKSPFPNWEESARDGSPAAG